MVRQSNTTGNLRMADMSELPVGQDGRERMPRGSAVAKHIHCAIAQGSRVCWRGIISLREGSKGVGLYRKNSMDTELQVYLQERPSHG